MSLNGFGGSSSVVTNTFSNITGQGAITALTIGTSGVATVLNLSGNTITNLISTGTGGSVIGLANANLSTQVNIDSNAINTLSSTGTTATVTAINMTATVSTGITNNTIQNLSASGISTPVITGIAATSTGAVIISTNSITGISTNGTATSGYTAHGILTNGTAGNFTILDNSIGNTTANAIAIGNATTTSGVCTFNGINNNSGTGSLIVSGNTIQNVTVYGTGASLFNGVLNTPAISSGTISNNTVQTITNTGTGSGYSRGISVANGTSVDVNQNVIKDLVANSITTGAVQGVLVSGGTTVNVFQNTISGLVANSLTTLSTGSINGVAVTNGTTVGVYRNKIYDLTTSSTAFTGTINGIIVSGSTASLVTTIRNNIIGDLKVTAGSGNDLVRGISILNTGTDTYANVYYNTIHLSAVSTGANFGSSGIYHAANATATIAQLDLRNNIIHNISTPNGTGTTVAFRRSSGAANTLNNYAPTSNNNLFFAGAQGATRLIYSDGTSSAQTLFLYQNGVFTAGTIGTRDSASITEDLVSDLKFLSLSGANANYLHMSTIKTTQIESGGAIISGVTIDYDNELRFGDVNYVGTGSAPDIGADEFGGNAADPLSGTYYVGIGQTYTSLTNSGGLFSAVNSYGMQGDLTVFVTSDLAETGAYELRQWIETGVGNYNLVIKPNSASTKLISGNVTAGLIRITGGDRATFDGSFNNSGNYFTIRNTNTAGTTGTALSFSNAATYNTIKNCTLEAYASATSGVVLFGTSTSTTGNNYNTIDSCIINGTVAGNSTIVGIYSAGTTGKENTSNTIKNNTIYNFLQRGIDIPSTGTTSWIISGNSIYNGSLVSSMSFPANTDFYGIRILGGSGYIISGNAIGGSATNAGSTNATYASTIGRIGFYGISLATTTPFTKSEVKSNVIKEISINSVPTGTSSVAFYGIDLVSTGSNIVVGGDNASDGNTIGSDTGNGSISITTNTAANTLTSLIRGINALSSKGTDGVIKNNKIGGIDINNIGAGPAASTFLGIYVTNASAPNVLSNSIGLSQAASIRVMPTSLAVATSINGINIGSTVTAMTVEGNTVQNIAKLNTTNTTGTFVGILSTVAANAVITINNNAIKNITIESGTTGVVSGITNTSTTSTSTEVYITNNLFDSFAVKAFNVGTSTLPYFTGVYNSSTIKLLDITGNTFTNYSTPQTGTGNISFIRNSGAVTTTLNINKNNLGTATNPLVNFTAANTGAHVFIHNTGGAITAALSISENDFRGINYTGANGTGANTYIFNSAATLSQNINKNTFTNLSVKTTGAITFISNSIAMRTNGIQNVKENKIATAFNKTAANGAVIFITSTASTTLLNAVSIHSDNDFSNVTVSGSSAVTGLVLTDSGTGLANRTIEKNNFNNWTGATGALTGLNVNIISNNNAIKNNVIDNISGSGSVVGITTATGNDKIFLNTISNLTTTGGSSTTLSGINVSNGTSKSIYENTISNLTGNAITSGSVRGVLISAGTAVDFYKNIISGLSANGVTTGTISGIWVSGGTTINCYRNKIYNLATASTVLSGAVYGIQVSGTTANLNTTLSNNIIGDLKVTAGSGTDLIRGIGVLNTGTTSNVKVYYNTIYLNAISTGANFGTSGVYHLANATATTSSLDLINNIVVNMSAPAGAGSTVAYRRSSSTLDNYAATSNANLFYAGITGATKLIFSDGTNNEQTLANYKIRMINRDQLSVTEDLVTDLKFISVLPTDATYLHLNGSKVTLAESGGLAINGYTVDFDGNIRFGNSGYVGTGTGTDIGADEFEGLFVNVWRGSVSQDWATVGNWTRNVVPAADASIVFDDLPVNDCYLDQDRSVTNITNTQSNFGLVLNGNKLTVKGNFLFSGGATIDASAVNSTMQFSGISAQTIPSGTFKNDAVYNLNINNGNNVLLSGNLNLTNALTTTTGLLDSFTNAPTLTYSGTTLQTIDGAKFVGGRVYNLTIDNAVGVNLGSNFTVINNMMINAGKKISVLPLYQLTATGTLTNNSDATGLVLLSDATGTASLLHNSNGVLATVERYISGAKEDWHFLSSPVSNQSISGSWTPSGTYGNGTGYDMYLWNEENFCWKYKLETSSVGNWSVVHPSNDFGVGRGYLYSVQSLNPTKEFTGFLNNGSISYPVTKSVSSDVALTDLEGFNLIGNPYPSSLDWQQATGWDRTSLVTSGSGYDMWIWNPAVNNYGVCNSATGIGTNSVTRYIAPMQGFFVKALVNNTISFDNRVRVHTGAGNWKKNAISTDKLFRVIVQSEANTSADEVLIQFGADANESGASKLFSPVVTAPSLYLNTDKEMFSVKYFTNYTDNNSIPLSFKAGVDGFYKLNYEYRSKEYSTVYLEDKLLKKVVPVSASTYYKFKSSVSDNENRFVLHFKPLDKVLGSQLSPYVYSVNSQIMVDLKEVSVATEMVIFDVSGKLLMKKSLESNVVNIIDANLPTQLLLITLENEWFKTKHKILFNSQK